MSLQSRIESLSTRHATLDNRIVDEHSRPGRDHGAINRLKLEKLRVKEELERLRGRH